jgi:hypothetical protein
MKQDINTRLNRLENEFEKYKKSWINIDDDGSVIVLVNSRELDEIYALLNTFQDDDLDEVVLNKVNNAINQYNYYYEIFTGERSNKPF